MKKIVSILLAAVLVLSSLSVTAFAVTADEANAQLSEVSTSFNNIKNTKFDANGSNLIDAADARLTLIYSAGLAVDNADTSKMDTDGDGKITAIDARNILRLSAGLDSIKSYITDSEIMECFNAVLNSIKPNRYSYYKWCSNTTDNVTYQDVDGVIASLDKQLAIYGDDMSFSEELVAAKGEVVYDYNTSTIRYVGSTFPISGNADYSSLLTMNNISKIEYNQNQSFTYNHYSKSATPVFSTNTVNGLDSIKVYIKNDSFSAFPSDMTALNHGKVFNVLTEDAVMNSVNEGNNMGSIGDMGDLGTCELAVGYTSMKYYNSYITVYFNPYNGNPVAIDYNMHYDLNMYMDIDIDFGILLKADGKVNLTNTVTEKTVYAFLNSNSDYAQFTLSRQ